MQLTQIRNATLKITYKGIRFLVDPWLGPKEYMPGFDNALHSEVRQPRTELPCPVEQIAQTDAVILTHFHPDHWDEYAARALSKEAPFFVQSEADRQTIAALGFTNVHVLETNGTAYGPIRLYKTAGQHGERTKIEPICRKMGMPYDAMGVVWQAEGEPVLYLAGDTIFCPEVAHALEQFRPDVVVVNACAARVITGDRLIMDQNDVLQVVQHAPQATVVASHMDTVSHLSVTREDLRRFVQEHRLDRVRIPQDGETLTFTK